MLHAEARVQQVKHNASLGGKNCDSASKQRSPKENLQLLHHSWHYYVALDTIWGRDLITLYKWHQPHTTLRIHPNVHPDNKLAEVQVLGDADPIKSQDLFEIQPNLTQMSPEQNSPRNSVHRP